MPDPADRAAVVRSADGPQAGLDDVAELAAEPRLAGYGYLATARAELLRHLDRVPEARTAYEEALLLTENQVERNLLRQRLDALPG